jgi:hypothetical protein
MTLEELEAVMDAYDVFDNALLYHAYKEYMRDYELVIESHVGPAPRGIYSYLFKYCVEVAVRTTVPDAVYQRSLDDIHLDHQRAKSLHGYDWGVKWSQIWEGWDIQADSPKAKDWSERIGIPFYEVTIETNAVFITLIFSELQVTQLSDQIDPGIAKAFIFLGQNKPPEA